MSPPTGRPGPVVVDLPKNVTMAQTQYVKPMAVGHKTYRPIVKAELGQVRQAVEMIATAKSPIFYTGGGVINSGPAASQLLREMAHLTGFPVTSTLMGLGAFPASDKQFIGMLGMHGTYEANMAMHDCDLMVNVGARFDDRITGRLDAFSPGSKKIHIDIDPSSINKTIPVDLPIVGDVGHVLEDLIKVWKSEIRRPDAEALKSWWATIDEWRKMDSLAFDASGDIIKPQLAVSTAVPADQRFGRLYHYRCRPASDVGGPTLQVRETQPPDDLGRAGHHGLWPAVGDWRQDRPPG